VIISKDYLQELKQKIVEQKGQAVQEVNKANIVIHKIDGAIDLLAILLDYAEKQESGNSQ
jgi:hypothetical protein